MDDEQGRDDSAPPDGPLRVARYDEDSISEPHLDESDNVAPLPYPPPEKSRKRPILIGLIVLAVSVLAGAGWLFMRPKPDSKVTQKGQAIQPITTPSVTGIATGTKHHKSADFRLEFDYPEDWTVDETVTGQLRVRSPLLKLKASDGRVVEGGILLSLRAKQAAMPEFDAGNATAVRNSEKISYTKPSSIQRGQTYLSFLTYAQAAGSGQGLNGVYITGDNGYNKGQAIPKADFQSVDPVINLSFIESSAETVEGRPPFGLAIDSWEDPALVEPLKSLLTSLVIN